jgi:hypothetical protein
MLGRPIVALLPEKKSSPFEEGLLSLFIEPCFQKTGQKMTRVGEVHGPPW